MKNDKIVKAFDILIKKLKTAISNINIKEEQINMEIKKWNCDINTTEIKKSLNLISRNINKWYENYKQSENILCISLKEYDLVAKEAAYLLGETALIDDLYSEIIDWEIRIIGNEIEDAIKKGGNINC